MKRPTTALIVLTLMVGVITAPGSAGGSSPAQLGKRTAKQWIDRLERKDRVAELKIDQVVTHLDLKPGDIIADIGAGTGVFSRPFARAVAPSGKALAVEVDRQLVDHIAHRAKEESISNLQAVLGEFDDPKLPIRNLDIAFFHNVIHHIEHRGLYVKNLIGYLKPTGRVVVIDQIDGHQDDPKQQITLDMVKEWMNAAGLKMVQEIDLYENKFFVVFAR